MYLVEGSPGLTYNSALSQKREAFRASDIRTMAAECYQDCRALSDLHSASDDLNVAVYEDIYEHRSSSPGFSAESFQVGRYTYEHRALDRRENSDMFCWRYFDGVSSSRLRGHGFSLSFGSWKANNGLWDSELSWRNVDRELAYLGEVDSLRAKLVGKVAGKAVAVKGHLVRRFNPDSEPGYTIKFVVSRVPSKTDKVKLVDRFNGILESQDRRNRFAKSYGSLPNSEPMAEATFVALFEELVALSPELLDKDPGRRTGLAELMGGRARREMRFSPARSGLFRSTETLSIVARRCDLCGVPRELKSIDNGFRQFDHSSASKVLEDAHRSSHCGQGSTASSSEAI